MDLSPSSKHLVPGGFCEAGLKSCMIPRHYLKQLFYINFNEMSHSFPDGVFKANLPLEKFLQPVSPLFECQGNSGTNILQSLLFLFPPRNRTPFHLLKFSRNTLQSRSPCPVFLTHIYSGVTSHTCVFLLFVESAGSGLNPAWWEIF